MNKKEQRALENRIRDVMEEPAELTSDEIAKIRERAYLAYQQKIENEKQPAREKRKKSGLLRRAVAVVAIAIGLIVVSVVYSVLAPVTVGNANSFVRRAAIWVNDQLHLGISFPVPEEESSIVDTDQDYFASLREASEKYNMPIIYINNLNELTFRGIETVMTGDDSPLLFLHYLIDGTAIDISIEKLNDDEILSIDSDNSISFQSPIGDVLIWETEGVSKAFIMIDGYYIEIYGLVSKEFLMLYCSSLAVIN